MSLPDLRCAADIASARRIVAGLLEQAGKESPALDARLLIGHALGVDHAALAASPMRMLTALEQESIARVTARRLNGEPVARIVGVKEFWGLPLKLSPATLVPRPETETIVEAALAMMNADRVRSGPLVIADLGTGSGALLLALLHEWPDAFGVGTDLNPDAIATARANAKALGLSQRAAFVVTDFGAAFTTAFDLLVSNPPYIASRDIPLLAPEVSRHDPRMALDGGADGLDAYHAIARQAPGLLRPGGLMVLEIGAGQAADVEAILAAGEGLESAAPIRCDLAGVPRAVIFRRKAQMQG